MEIGRLRTLSLAVESRKFNSPEDKRNRNVRVGCIVPIYYISRRGLTRVAYPGQGNARARRWDKREVVTPTSFYLT